jgi:hypothetical protein
MTGTESTAVDDETGTTRATSPWSPWNSMILRLLLVEGIGASLTVAVLATG